MKVCHSVVMIELLVSKICTKAHSVIFVLGLNKMLKRVLNCSICRVIYSDLYYSTPSNLFSLYISTIVPVQEA